MIDFYTKTAIDTFQSAKKMVVDTFVKHEGLSKSLHDFVDVQTEYTKKAVDETITAGTNVYKTITEKNFFNDLVVSAKEYTNYWSIGKKGK